MKLAFALSCALTLTSFIPRTGPGILSTGITWEEPAAATQKSNCMVEHVVRVLEPIPFFNGSVDIGSKVHIVPGGGRAPFNATFIGRSVTVNGKEYYAFFKEGSSSEIFVIPPTDSIRIESMNGQALTSKSFRSTVHSINQVGETCAAYSVFNCFRQLQIHGKQGNGNLNTKLRDEVERVSFLTGLINDLYIEARGSSNLEKVIQNKAAEHGFEVTNIPGMSRKFKQWMIESLEKGQPVVLRYNHGRDVQEMPYSIVELAHQNGKTYAQTLWLPVKPGEASTGGHAVLATGYFEHHGEHYVIISDPNFAHPRLWNVNLFDRGYIANMHGWAISEKETHSH
jgi:hypothetical protein